MFSIARSHTEHWHWYKGAHASRHAYAVFLFKGEINQNIIVRTMENASLL